jgi:hypothetical protein
MWKQMCIDRRMDEGNVVYPPWENDDPIDEENQEEWVCEAENEFDFYTRCISRSI